MIQYTDAQRLFSSARMQKYLRACEGDKNKAMMLYSYNAIYGSAAKRHIIGNLSSGRTAKEGIGSIKAQTRKYAGAGTFGSYGCKGTTKI